MVHMRLRSDGACAYSDIDFMLQIDMVSAYRCGVSGRRSVADV